MSLINNVLKQLEKRTGNASNNTAIPLAYVPTKTLSGSPRKFFFMSSVAIILLLLTVLIFLPARKTKTHIKPMLTTSSQHSAPITVQNTTSKWLTTTTITGITLQVKDNITEMIFMLDHPALYRLISDNIRNQLSIIIEHAQLQAALPGVNSLQTAIQQITIQKFNSDTRFNIVTYPGASVKYVNLNNENKNPELVIAIEYPATYMNNYSATEISSSADDSKQLIKAPVLQTWLAQQYQSALATAESGNYTAAIAHLSALVNANPSYKDARVSLVAILIEQGYRLVAKRYIDAGLNLTPNYPPFIELKARLLTLEGKSKLALALLQTISPTMEENPEYHALLAALYEKNNKDLFAVNIYKQLLTLNSHNGSWWFGLGFSLDKLGNAQAATQAYSNAMAAGHLSSESMDYLQNRLQSTQEDNYEKE